MKKETLAKRLAEKTNTPILEQVLMEEQPMEALPATCMIWQGAVDRPAGEVKMQKRRLQDGSVYPDRQMTYGYPVIRYQKKRHAVQRLIFQLINRPNFEFTLQRTCTDERCVNPYHFTVHKGEEVETAAPPEEKPLVQGDEWTLEEVEEVIEILLSAENGDLLNHPDLTDAPPEMVLEVLTKFNKEHLA